jgi:hypothetical protein
VGWRFSFPDDLYFERKTPMNRLFTLYMSQYTSLSRLKLVSLACFALLLAAGALFWPAGVAQAHCTGLHPHHCVDDVIETVLTPHPTIMPVQQATKGFLVVNNSSNTLYVARGWRTGGGTSQSAGDYNLPAMSSKTWDAQGWWPVEPYTSEWIYKSSDAGEMYFRIQSNGEALVPNNHSGSASFCVQQSYAFHSKEYDDGKFDLMYDASGNSYINHVSQQDSCSDSGGEWSTFYKMKIMTTFTVN